MERIGTIAIGDWALDYGGQFSELKVHMSSGSDVSNKRLFQAYKDAVESIGVDFGKIFSDFENTSIDFEDLERICESGYKIHPYAISRSHVVKGDQGIGTYEIFDEIPEAWYISGKESNYLISAGHMLMFYLGYGIDDFKYEFVDTENDYIIGPGAKDAPLYSFGDCFFNV